MWISYFLEDREYATRDKDIIPRVGEKVRFRGIDYPVIGVTHIEDQDKPKIYVELK